MGGRRTRARTLHCRNERRRALLRQQSEEGVQGEGEGACGLCGFGITFLFLFLFFVCLLLLRSCFVVVYRAFGRVASLR
jgi:hypothetical protein